MSSGISLSAHLAANPQLVGAPVLKRFSISDGSLPFLFKVLSIRKALSIQAHPDKHKAEQLHASNPHVYKGPLFSVIARIIRMQTMASQFRCQS
jgi:mannose-6-phosphate isomerase